MVMLLALLGISYSVEMKSVSCLFTSVLKNIFTKKFVNKKF